MKKQGIIYLFITFLFILCSIIIIQNTNLLDSVALSKSIQIILILFLMKISYGCAIYSIIIFVPSGGQGKDEVIAEAEAMKNYLLEQGIEEKNIIVENKSTNTIENIKYSNSIIIKNKEDAKISFSTTNYHVFRSGVIANECGVDCEGMGSKTKWYFYTNALIREFIANLAQERKKHIILILLINFSVLILIFIGYFYQLIKF